MSVKVGNDFTEFMGDKRIIGSQAAHLSKCLTCFVVTIFLHEPSGTFVLKNYSGKKERARQHLKGKWNTPLSSAARGDGSGHAVIYKVRQHDARDAARSQSTRRFHHIFRWNHLLEELHRANTATPDLLVHIFTNVCRHHGRYATHANTPDDSAHVEQSK